MTDCTLGVVLCLLIQLATVSNYYNADFKIDKETHVIVTHVSSPSFSPFSSLSTLIPDSSSSSSSSSSFTLFIQPYSKYDYPSSSSGITNSTLRPPSSPLFSSSGVSELVTYVQTFSHTTSTGLQAWSIRIGSSGQIYSINDSVGNQYIGSLPQSQGGEWEDRVYQMQFSSTSWTNIYNPNDLGGGFSTQAGLGPTVSGSPPAYGIILNQGYNSTSKTYSIQTIPAQACAYNWNLFSDPTAFEINAIQQVSFRDLGDITSTVSGFEVTYVFTNFGPQTYDSVSLWSGFDPTHLSYRWDSLYTNSPFYQYAGNNPPIWTNSYSSNTFLNYDGWSAFTNTSGGMGSTFALILQYNSSLTGNSHPALQFGPSDSISYILGYGLGNYIISPGQSFFSKYYMLFSTIGVQDISTVAVNITNNNMGIGNLPLNLSQALPFTNCTLLMMYFPHSPCSLFSTLDIPAYYPVPVLILQQKSTGNITITTLPYFYPAIQTAYYVSPVTEPVSTIIGFLGWAIKKTNLSLSAPCNGMSLLSTILSSNYYLDTQVYQQDAWVITNPSQFIISRADSIYNNSYIIPSSSFNHNLSTNFTASYSNVWNATEFFPLENNYTSVINYTVNLFPKAWSCGIFLNDVYNSSICPSPALTANIPLSDNFTLAIWGLAIDTGLIYAPGFIGSLPPTNNNMGIIGGINLGQSSLFFNEFFINVTNTFNSQQNNYRIPNIQASYYWSHYTISFDGNAITSYVNGTFANSYTQLPNIWTTASHEPYQFGSGWIGNLWHAYYWNYTVSSTVINQLYNYESSSSSS